MHFRPGFWSPSSPVSRHFGIFRGPTCVTTGSTWAENTCLSILKGVESILEQHVFHQFLTHFWSHSSPISRHFGIFHGTKRVTLGPKWARNTYLSTLNDRSSLLEKHVFHPFFNHFWSQNNPFSRHFGIFHGPKRVTTGSKWATNTCLSIPNLPRSLLEKRVST